MTNPQRRHDISNAAWAKAYEISNEILSGQRPMPTLDDMPAILAKLPELRWPDEAA